MIAIMGEYNRMATEKPNYVYVEKCLLQYGISFEREADSGQWHWQAVLRHTEGGQYTGKGPSGAYALADLHRLLLAVMGLAPAPAKPASALPELLESTKAICQLLGYDFSLAPTVDGWGAPLEGWTAKAASEDDRYSEAATTPEEAITLLLKRFRNSLEQQRASAEAKGKELRDALAMVPT